MTRHMCLIWTCACALAWSSGNAMDNRVDSARNPRGENPVFAPRPEPLNRVDDMLFGHFMERAAFEKHSEPGYDAAWLPGLHRLDPRAVSLMEHMRIPLIRYPAGENLKHIDWRDLIDNVPGREGGRPPFKINGRPPMTNAFGLDEFLRLCRQLGAEPLLPVSFHSAFGRRVPLEEAARPAAGLVAYCNAPPGASLPMGMPDWPAVRERNGRAEPWRIEYFEIGNEVWTYSEKLLVELGLADASPEEQAEWHVKCLRAYAEAMRAVDPSITLLADLRLSEKPTPFEKAVHRLLAETGVIDLYVLHTYQPWRIKEILKDGKPVPADSLSEEEIWNAWVSTPGCDPETGEAAWRDPRMATARSNGWELAVTEWNWNGWWELPGEGKNPAFDSDLARALGAAGWLNAFIRDGGIIRMACQSMLVGSSWNINSIRVSPGGDKPPFMFPAGQVTALYSRLHGNRRLAMEARNVPCYEQPFKMGLIAPSLKVAILDAVATASESRAFIHVINRSFSEDIQATVDMSAFDKPPSGAVIHTLTRSLHRDPALPAHVSTPAVPDRSPIPAGESFPVRFPRRSVCVLEIEL